MYYSTFKISVELATTPGWRTTMWGLLNYVPKGPDLEINKRDLEKFVIMHASLTERIIRCSYEMTVFVHGSRDKPLKYQNHCFKTVGRERFCYANLLVYFNSPGSHFSSTCWPLIILCSIMTQLSFTSLFSDLTVLNRLLQSQCTMTSLKILLLSIKNSFLRWSLCFSFQSTPLIAQKIC